MLVTHSCGPDIVTLVKPPSAVHRAIQLSLQAARLQLIADLAPTRVLNLGASVAAVMARRAARLAIAFIKKIPED